MVKGTLAYSVRLNGKGRLLSRLYADLQVIDQLHYRDHRIHNDKIQLLSILAVFLVGM